MIRKGLGFFLALMLAMAMLPASAHAQRPSFYYTFGPVLHLNNPGGQSYYSLSIEFSYWYDDQHFIPVGVSGGFERSEGLLKVHLDLQAGYFVGLSGGAFLQEGKKGVGFQTAAWGWYILGLEMRYSRIGDTRIWSPGIFEKLPVGGDW